MAETSSIHFYFLQKFRQDILQIAYINVIGTYIFWQQTLWEITPERIRQFIKDILTAKLFWNNTAVELNSDLGEVSLS